MTTDLAIAKLALELHPDRIEAIASSLECVSGADIIGTVKANAGLPYSDGMLQDLEEALQVEAHVSGKDLAMKFRVAGATASLASGISATEIVWSGPSSGMVPVRRTMQVLKGVIDGAKENLFLVSFVAYNVPDVMASLQAAISKGIKIRILLERSSEDGGSLDVNSLKMMQSKLPGVEFYGWAPGEPGSDGPKTKVHAKYAIADGEVAFVTSANLTNAAMESNVELGLLVTGGNVPYSLHRHLNSLVVTKQIVLV